MIREIVNANGVTVAYQARLKHLGKKIYKCFDSHQEAQRWINEVRFKRDKGVSIHGPVSAKQLFDRYLAYAETKGRSPGTLSIAESRFKNHIEKYFHGIDMKTISVEEFERYFQYLRRKKETLSPASCNRVRSLLLVMYNTAIKKQFFEGTFLINPIKSIEAMEEDQSIVEYWDQESIDKLLKAAKDDFYYPMYVMMINTGVRIGELTALDGEQFDAASHVVTIDRTWVESINDIRKKPKGKAIRHIGLNATVRAAIYPLLQAKKGRVFIKPDGTPIAPNYVRNHVLPAICKKAEIKNIGPHGFRHTFSAHFLMKGGSMWDLSKILGHSSIETTERYYAHFSSAHIQKRAAVVEFGNPSQPDPTPQAPVASEVAVGHSSAMTSEGAVLRMDDFLKGRGAKRGAVKNG